MFDDVQVRDVPEQVVLTEQQHVAIDELDTWLSQTIAGLTAAAKQHGGVAAPVFVVYHGEVNQDSDGPVEVCVPVSSTNGDGATTRVEPAHREAYVRLRKAQVEFPQILSAYDAVSRWVKDSGRTVACPPREVYFNDFEAAGAEDEVCDVAFPVA